MNRDSKILTAMTYLPAHEGSVSEIATQVNELYPRRLRGNIVGADVVIRFVGESGLIEQGLVARKRVDDLVFCLTESGTDIAGRVLGIIPASD